MLHFCKWSQLHDFSIASDAAGSIGLGIVFGNAWAYAAWPDTAPTNIAVLELIALVVGAVIWGPSWSGRDILFETDSMAAKFSVESQLPPDLHLAALVRELAIQSVLCDFRFKVTHVPGKLNVLPDLLSRERFAEFRRRHPSADRTGTPLPGGLIHRLCNLI